MPLAAQIDLPERYRVVRHIASGGMASVWQAHDEVLDRVVAIKVLSAQFTAQPGARERFQREARTAAQVSDHPNVVTIYDIGDHQGRAFIVMEHFSGGTVADRLRAWRDGGGRVPRATALRWLHDAAAGLDVAHAASIVHRDVKPANLLLDAQERLAVADFGIARLIDDTRMTQTGQVLGTAAYLSPEQALGQPATDASDRYALAVVAHELLTGQRPFTAQHPTAQARQHIDMPPPPASDAAPDLPQAVDGVLARGLAKQPRQRPASATAFVGDIEAALQSATPTTRRVAATRVAPALAPTAVVAPSRNGAARADSDPATAPHPALDRPRRRLVPLAAIGAAALVAGGAIAFATSGGDTGSPSAQASGTKTTAARTTAGAASQTNAPTRSTPVAPAAPTPAQLNDQGYALSQQGRYDEAVVPLQAAVNAYEAKGDTHGLPYAFALYNLAVALARSGHPAAAVPLLLKRLTFHDQNATVQAELDRVQQLLGGGAGAGGPGKPGKAKGLFKHDGGKGGD